MDIALYDETKQLDKQYLSLIEQMIVATSKKLSLNENFEVSVIIVDNLRIREINKEYRMIDKVTDVISFAMEDSVDSELEDIFTTNIEEIETMLPKMLGDIFISLEKAEEQAEVYGHSLIRELCFLTVHGFLHLNGFDHQNEKEEKEMFDLQKEILEENNIER